MKNERRAGGVVWPAPSSSVVGCPYCVIPKALNSAHLHTPRKPDRAVLERSQINPGEVETRGGGGGGGEIFNPGL